MNAASGERLHARVLRAVDGRRDQAREAYGWLRAQMPPYFFLTAGDDPELLASLALALSQVGTATRVVLSDREDSRVIARLNQPGSVVDTLDAAAAREIAYAELTRSQGPCPGTEHELEVYRLGFAPVRPKEPGGSPLPLPKGVRARVRAALRARYPDFPASELDPSLGLLWASHPGYVGRSPAERVARALWLYLQGRRHGGLYLDVDNEEDLVRAGESRLVFAVGNPPQGNFLSQVMEVFHRLQIGVRRLYCLTFSTGVHPYFLGSFYVATRGGGRVEKATALFEALQKELYNTQILSTRTRTYADFVKGGVLSGDEASLLDALISFCHTTLAHTHPDSYGLEDVMRAFHSHPDLALVLIRLFQTRFDPDRTDRERAYPAALAAARRAVAEHNTGHKFLDDFRRVVFRTGLSLVRHTLKTNFYVPEKHALAFRLDPAYLDELGPEFTRGLPPRRPFRVTFFHGRSGVGYHVGFADIARGGWRTVIAHSRDDYVTNANPLFREVSVLAHTQHLKNKDIYEGGSKLVAVLDASGLQGREAVTQRLYKLQYGFANAFLDIFVTRNGRAAHPRVVDYYGEDEAIELGPDENMHDEMIEQIADLSARRGYLLGRGIMSSKRVGINHKEYGVTSTGVVKFAQVALEELGIDIARDPFAVKMTGGPGGDVAGNALRLLLARCPGVRVVLIVDGSGVLCDPAGADRAELGRIVLRSDLDAFDPARLGPGGFLLYRGQRRREGLAELYRRVERGPDGLAERWVSTDEFHREFDGVLFHVPADLFLPAGGRPETVDGGNWERFFAPDGTPTCRAIVEGANSFITPEARVALQKRGILVIRDASANKCGVISSSYEIIANLLLTDREFLAHKGQYVADVLEILERRAEDEARLILRRRRESGGGLLCTEISEGLSGEINGHFEEFFRYFQRRPELAGKGVFRRALLAHLPRLLRDTPRLRARVGRLPPKYRAAILASEAATTVVYRGGWEPDLGGSLKAYLERTLTGPDAAVPAATGRR